LSAAPYFARSPFAVLMNLIAKIGVVQSHGGKFHERCNFTDRLFL
jgi:hypothetical protein